MEGEKVLRKFHELTLIGVSFCSVHPIKFCRRINIAST